MQPYVRSWVNSGSGSLALENDAFDPFVILPTADIRERSCSRLLARSPLFLRLGRRASPGTADGSHLPAAAASAEELIAAIGLEPRHTHSRRHLELLQDLSRSRIDPPQVALVAFPSAVPELAVDPGDPGNNAVGFDGAKNGSCFGIDLMDLPVSVLPYPERAFRPCEPRSARDLAVLRPIGPRRLQRQSD
jgi:hypothetical protein